MTRPPPNPRPWLLAALLAALLAPIALARPAASRAAPPRGISATAAGTPAAPAVRVAAPGRFDLTIDGQGIAAWSSPAAGDARNLVPAGARLVEHRGPDGAPFAGTPRLLAASPLRATVRIESPAGPALTYTVWAGGQVSIEAAGGVGSQLRLDPASASGATLRQLDGAALLYLDAWTPDDPAPALAAAPALDATGAILAERAGDGPLVVTVPEGVLRQPRIRVAGWPGPAVSVQLAGRPLVAGVDYLAEWDAAEGELTLQYLGLLVPGPAAARTFTLGLEQAPALALEILSQDGAAARSLSPEGLLRVDANLPAQDADTTPRPAPPGRPSARDIFDIPYIQTWPDLRLRATVASPPAGFGGVRFTVSGPAFSATVDDTNPADGLAATVALPRRAEYRVVASALVGGQPAEPSRTIERAAYGRVFVGVGDSITAGQWGFFRLPGGPGYPFVAPPAPGSGVPASADGRNYPQADNFADDLIGGLPADENPYFTGYLPELNDALSACLASPVFLLNDGVSGARTARDTYKGDPAQGGVGVRGYKNVLGKAAAIRSHLRQLGAGQVLLQIGTNDASTVILNTTQFNDPVPAGLYNEDLRAVIGALRQDDPGLSVWVARLPWRNDRRAAEPVGVEEQKRAKTLEFNGEIAGVVADLGSRAPVFLGPDFYAHFAANQGQITLNDPTDTTPPIRTDLLHPTAEGFTAMAGLWAQAICQRIGAEPPPGSTATPTVSPTPTAPRNNRSYLPLTRR